MNQTGNTRAARDRVQQVAGQMKASGKPSLLEKHPDDVVVTAALRTALTKGGKGGFKVRSFQRKHAFSPTELGDH